MIVQVRSFAKLNLDLRVLHKRADQFHELRTVFQTISLHDTLTLEAARAVRTQFNLTSSIDIEDNLVVRAARAVLDHLKITARIRFVLAKRIPMGGGLGGGSSNAAAVLLALPALLRKKIHVQELVRLAESLGSDVPFFLFGGTAVGLGRGTELYPLPDPPGTSALVIAPGIHVSTPEAYRALSRSTEAESRRGGDALTSFGKSHILREFQALVWDLESAGLHSLFPKNDFEEVVFRRHPELGALSKRLRRLGGRPVLMTGSGSSLFGIFGSMAETKAAALKFQKHTAFPVRFVSRRQYESSWRRALAPAAAAR